MGVLVERSESCTPYLPAETGLGQIKPRVVGKPTLGGVGARGRSDTTCTCVAAMYISSMIDRKTISRLHVRVLEHPIENSVVVYNMKYTEARTLSSWLMINICSHDAQKRSRDTTQHKFCTDSSPATLAGTHSCHPQISVHYRPNNDPRNTLLFHMACMRTVTKRFLE